VLAKRGEVEKGIALTRQGLADYQAAGSRVGQTYVLSLLAEMCGKLNQVETGLSLLNEGLEVANMTEERFYEAELYRLKGELTIQSEASQSGAGASLKSTCTEKAEEFFQHALDVARRQNSKAWELRAATSLAGLWQKQNKKAEAHELLAEIYSWFTEGYDTADLKDAKVLLLTMVGP
jgi:predicted ATPase